VPSPDDVLGEAEEANRTVLDLRLSDECPFALLSRKDAFVRECTDRLNCGDATDTVEPAKLTDRGNLISRAPLASGDAVAERLAQLVIERNWAAHEGSYLSVG
jgi:hypothetical protein